MPVVDPRNVLLTVVACAGIAARIKSGNERPCFTVVIGAVIVCNERVTELAVDKSSVVMRLPETAVGSDSQTTEQLVRKKLICSRRADDASPGLSVIFGKNCFGSVSPFFSRMNITEESMVPGLRSE